jgi:hypothetical protein
VTGARGLVWRVLDRVLFPIKGGKMRPAIATVLHPALCPPLLVALFLAMGTLSCAISSGGRGAGAWCSEVEDALEKADANRGALEGVLQHYRARGDSLKLRAAEYLLEHMEGHCFARFALYDSAGTEMELDVLAYPDYDALRAALDSIEDARGELDFKRLELVQDLEAMPADYLVENIDLAFQAWQRKPWARHLTFADFCAYVLPYRGSNEPLECWRSFFLDRYADLVDQAEDPADPVAVAELINGDLKSWFKFDPRFYLHPTDQGLSEMLIKRMGRCEDMTNITIYAMRANGLAVTSDYTPYWANSGNNHAWNSILTREGGVVMFMGAEAHPGHYRLANRVGKVYRKTYAKQRDNLVFRKEEWEKVPRWLSGKNYVDVTSDYTDVADVTIDLEVSVPDSANYAYLCVFNDGEWKAIHWGPITDGTVTFVDMGRNVAYVPMYFVREELTSAGAAFILEPGGEIRRLIPREDSPISPALVGTTRRRTAESTDGIEKVFLDEEREYELFYWNGEWVSVAEAIAGPEPLVFDGVPAGALYWLVGKDSRKDERIFTFEDGVQVWW